MAIDIVVWFFFAFCSYSQHLRQLLCIVLPFIGTTIEYTVYEMEIICTAHCIYLK